MITYPPLTQSQQQMNKSQTMAQMAFLTEAEIDDSKVPKEKGLDKHRFKLRITAKDKLPHATEVETSKAKKLPLFKDIMPRYDVEAMKISSYAKHSESALSVSEDEHKSTKTLGTQLVSDQNTDIQGGLIANDPRERAGSKDIVRPIQTQFAETAKRDVDVILK